MPQGCPLCFQGPKFAGMAVSAGASMLLGGLWYGPIFGEVFVRETYGKTMAQFQREMEGVDLTIPMLTSTIMAVLLGVFLTALHKSNDVKLGAAYGFSVGLCIFCSVVTGQAWTGNGHMLSLVHGGYNLVLSTAIGALTAFTADMP